jgi:transcriptional regulator with XRE-family HTH domain
MITGQDLRAARKAKNISLCKLAEMIGRDKGHLSRVERGAGREATPALIRDYQRVLGETVAATTDDPRQDRPITVDAVKRRTFLAGVVATAANATDPATSRVLGRVGVDTNAAPQIPTGGIGPVERFRHMRRVLAETDNLFGPKHVISTVHEQIKVLDRNRHKSQGDERRQFLLIQIEFADLLGWLHQDSADHHAAQYWLDRALEWSHIAEDPKSTVFVLARKSQLAGDMGESGTAVEVADAAMNMAGSRGRLAAIAATYSGHGHALRGDLAASQRAYDTAHTLQNPADEDSGPWGMFFDDAYIEVQRAHSLAVLGDHNGAISGFQTAIAALPPTFHRDRGVYLAREAMAHISVKDSKKADAEQAAMLGLQALDICTATNSGRIMAVLSQLDGRISRWNTSGVAQFREAMKDLMTVPSPGLQR